VKKTSALLGAVTAGLLVLAGCAANETPAETATPEATDEQTPEQEPLSGELTGSGASSQSAAQEAWKAGFAGMQPDVVLSYDPQGSGAGRQQFQDGAVDFVGTDSAFKQEELDEGDFPRCASKEIVEIPAYISPIAVAFNLDGIDNLNLDAATIAKIFVGDITKWNDPAIAGLNADVTLPDLAIVAVHRSDKSGTTGNFTDYLSQVAGEVWTYGDVEEWPLNSGEAAEKTQGVKEVLSGTVGAVGYIDASQATDLGTASIKVGEEFVPFSAEAAAKAVAISETVPDRGDNDLAFKLNRTTTEAGVYPLVLVSYLAACQNYTDANTGAMVKAYLSYVTSQEGQAAAADNAGSAPIQGEQGLAEKVMKAVDSIG